MSEVEVVNTGQHRRTGEPLKQRLTKLVASSTGTHRRRKHRTTQPSRTQPSTTQEHSHGGYQNGTPHPGAAA